MNSVVRSPDSARVWMDYPTLLIKPRLFPLHVSLPDGYMTTLTCRPPPRFKRSCLFLRLTLDPMQTTSGH